MHGVADPIRLRALTSADADVMAVVLRDPSLYEFTGGEPPTADELTRRYDVQARGQSPDGTERWVNDVVLLGGEQQPIGYVQATIPSGGGTAEIAWVIGRAWQGHGHATRAARLLLASLAEQDVETVVAHIHPDHTASQRIATHLGLEPTSTILDGEVRWQGRSAPSRSGRCDRQRG